MLAITWSAADAERIRDTARDIGVTAECLVQYAVQEVLDQATFRKAAAKHAVIEVDGQHARGVIDHCDQEDVP